MLNKTVLFNLIIILLFLSCQSSLAQTAKIDTIVVDFAKDTIRKKIKEITPVLDLGAMKNQAKADSMANIKLAKNKEDVEKRRLEELKEKRKKEKIEKENKLKALAEKRKLEKEAREKAFAEKKKRKEEEEKKKKEEKKIAKEKAREEKKEEREKKNEAKIAKQKEETKEKTIKKNKSVVMEAEEKAKVLDKVPEVNVEEKIVQATTKQEEPKVPEGVEQKDNTYGTVRLAFDDLAASFLLTIPTETKMHYHKKHSEHILLIEGQGMVLMGYKTIKLKKNELIFITKGTPHKIINNGKGKLKVLSIQSPFYSGKDIIILE